MYRTPTLRTTESRVSPPKGGKSGEKLDLVKDQLAEVEEGFQISSRERKKLKRLQKATYWDTDSIEEVRKELPDAVRVTRGLKNKAGNKSLVSNQDRSPVLQSETLLKNRFAAFEVVFTPGHCTTGVNTSVATNQNFSTSDQPGSSSVLHAKRNLEEALEEAANDQEIDQESTYVALSGLSPQSNIIVIDKIVEINSEQSGLSPPSDNSVSDFNLSQIDLQENTCELSSQILSSNTCGRANKSVGANISVVSSDNFHGFDEHNTLEWDSEIPSLSTTKPIKHFSAQQIWDNRIDSTEELYRDTTTNITESNIEVEKSKNSETTSIFDRRLYSEEFLELIEGLDMASSQPASGGVDPNQPPPIMITIMGKKFTIQNHDPTEVFDYVCQVYTDMTNFKTQSKDYDTLTLPKVSEIVVNLKDLSNSLVVMVKLYKQYGKDSTAVEGMERTVAYMALSAMERLNMLKDAELGRVQRQQAAVHMQQGNGAQAQFTLQDRTDIDLLQNELDHLKDILLNQTVIPTSPYRKKVPTLIIKPFKGDKKDFQRFRTAFLDKYEGTGLGKISLAIHLGENMEGEAKKNFAYMVDTADENTYENMWSTMETFYGTSKKLALEKLEKFTCLPVIKSFNPSTISMLYTMLEEHWVLLKQAMKEQFLEEDCVFFYSFLKKLPIHEVARYKTECRLSEAKENFPTFKEWLKNQWEDLKESKEKGTPDRALTFWQSGVVDPRPNCSTFFGADSHYELPPKSEVLMSNCKTKKLEFDVDGNARMFYKTPANETHVIIRDGEVKVVDDYIFETTSDDMCMLNNNQVAGNRPGFKPRKVNQAFGGNKRPIQRVPEQNMVCAHCKKTGHFVYKCDLFKSIGIKAKMLCVRENRLCLRCLSPGHIARDCKIKFACDVDKCGGKHHRLIHGHENSKAYILAAIDQQVLSDVESDDDDKN